MAAETLPERIKELLGKGLPTGVVASAVGCDPSYISQLLEQEEFHNDVLVLRAGKAESSVARDDKWDDIEDRALKRAGQILDFVTKPNDLIRIAALANSAKRRASDFTGGSEAVTQTVQLVFPESAVLHFQMNANSQVVEIDGRSTQALSSKKLVEQIAQRKIARETLGITDVVVPPKTSERERTKVVSILEQIGYADEAVPVQKVV